MMKLSEVLWGRMTHFCNGGERVLQDGLYASMVRQRFCERERGNTVRWWQLKWESSSMKASTIVKNGHGGENNMLKMRSGLLTGLTPPMAGFRCIRSLFDAP